VQPTPYRVARHGGTRYHVAECQALTQTRALGNEVTITRAAVLARRLLPCGLCICSWNRITPLAAVS
jgi:hypothetical protein